MAACCLQSGSPVILQSLNSVGWAGPAVKSSATTFPKVYIWGQCNLIWGVWHEDEPVNKL